jgi:hypothetical protein
MTQGRNQMIQMLRLCGSDMPYKHKLKHQFLALFGGQPNVQPKLPHTSSRKLNKQSQN